MRHHIHLKFFNIMWLTVFASLLTLSTSSWCNHGTIIESNNECLCNLEGEDSCVGSGCISGYGSSFYPKSCASCRCKSEDSFGKEKKISNREVEGNIEELDKYMNWRDELARAKSSSDPNKRKQFIVVAFSVAIFSILSTLVCCLIGTYIQYKIILALRKLIQTNLLLVRWVVSFRHLCYITQSSRHPTVVSVFA